MKRAFSAAFAAVLTFGLAAAAFAEPSLTSVTAEGTVGTQLTITGTELGTAAPKVALRLTDAPTSKPIPLKAGKPTGGATVTATILKIAPGQYDLLVTPKGGAEMTLEGAFTARAPNVTSLSALKAALGDTIDINGGFFGAKKGKVTIDGVTAKVKSWADGKITVVISKKSGAGAGLTIDVFGKGGTTEDAATIELVAPISGKDHITINFDSGGGTMVATDPKTTKIIVNTGVSFVLNGTKPYGGGINTNTHILNVVVIGAPNEGVYSTNIIATYQEAGLAAQMYSSSGGGAFTLTVTQRAGSRVQGTFSGTLIRTLGSGPAVYNVTGEFTLTIK